jgi:hypothetical protein
MQLQSGNQPAKALLSRQFTTAVIIIITATTVVIIDPTTTVMATLTDTETVIHTDPITDIHTDAGGGNDDAGKDYAQDVMR